MIGSLLKQLFVALGRFIGYHSGRVLGVAAKRPAGAQSEALLVAMATPENAIKTATEISIASLDDSAGLDSQYVEPVQWPCHRTNTPPPEVTSNSLYKLWSGIPNGLKWTHYFPVYEAIFGPIRTSPLRILEIGIWQGASVRLWRHYFQHPDSVIVGVDILPECQRFDSPESGIHVRIGSQADPVFLQKVVDEFGPFDLIIDDGSHHSSHIIASFNHLFAHGLKDTGIYFGGDLHANYWHPWRDSKKSFLDVCKELLEHMNAHYRAAAPVDFLIAPPSARLTAALEVPRITTMLKEIRFFDSIVAIYKARLDYVPYTLLRENRLGERIEP